MCYMRGREPVLRETCTRAVKLALCSPPNEKEAAGGGPWFARYLAPACPQILKSAA